MDWRKGDRTAEGWSDQEAEERSRSSNDKFGELVLGDAKQFFKGLDALIGVPNHLDLEGSVKKEHESEIKFTTSNYHITTHPKQEWNLVFDKGKELDGGWKEENKSKIEMKKRPHIDLEELVKAENMAEEINMVLKSLSKCDQVQVTVEQVKAINLTPLEAGVLRMYTGKEMWKNEQRPMWYTITTHSSLIHYR